MQYGCVREASKYCTKEPVQFYCKKNKKNTEKNPEYLGVVLLQTVKRGKLYFTSEDFWCKTDDKLRKYLYYLHQLHLNQLQH